ELGSLEVLLEEDVVRLGDGLDELLTGLGDGLDQLRGNSPLLEGSGVALVEEGAAGEHVDHAAKAVLAPDRHLEDRGLGPDRAQTSEGVVDGRALAVHPGDEGDARERELVGPGPDLLRLALDLAAGRAEDEDRAGSRPEAVPRVVEEGRVAGRVDQIEV